MLGLAGAGKPLVREQVLQLALDGGWAKHTRVVPDPLPVIAAGSRNMHGIALICGTGSMAWAQTDDGRTARAGGEGIEDPGSGYWIGVQTIQTIADEKIQGESLRRIADRIEAVDIDWPNFQPPEDLDLAEMFFDWEVQRRAVASIAPDVFELAESEPVIARIFDAAVDELALLVHSIDVDLKGYELLPLFLAGGVFTNQPDFAARVAKAAGRENAKIIYRPVLGSVSLAAERLK